MADARQQGQSADTHEADDALAKRAEHEAERLAAQAREAGRQAGSAGSEIAQGVQEITAAWARYGEEVMRQTAEASRALLNCHGFGEMLEVQARLLRGNLQAFLDQSSKIADIAGRMAARPSAAPKPAGTEPSRR